MKETKAKLVQSIIEVTKAPAEVHFNTLIDMNNSRLQKLLKVCTLMSKNAVQSN